MRNQLMIGSKLKGSSSMIHPMAKDEETPQQRAERILQESIAFRTSLISEIHNQIHEEACYGWGIYHPHSNMSASRTSERTLKFIDTTCAEMGKGRRQYIGSVKY
jgi:hypothetical protein